MSMRQLSLGDKKLRGIPRRMRSLQRWSESFFYKFPSISDEDISYGYWNMKIPVSLSLVQGKQTNKTIKSSCAQALIDAAYNIYQLKPNDKSDIRVTCIIALPDMFSSEICLFTSEDYFKLHTQTGISYLGELNLLKDRSLVREWNLNLPKGFSEIGILSINENEDGEIYQSEYWHIGEVE